MDTFEPSDLDLGPIINQVQNSLTFWYHLAQVILEYWPSNVCNAIIMVNHIIPHTYDIVVHLS